MNSDEDKIYMIIVAFAEVYNFVVQAFLIPSYLWTQKNPYTIPMGWTINSVNSARPGRIDDGLWAHDWNEGLRQIAKP
jgi:hypothetical protein